jgi:tetratricopeptide (TPR) repeat protein
VVEALSTPDRSPSPVSEDAVVARLTGAFKSPPPAAEPPGPTFVRTGEPLRDGLLVELGLVEATSPNRPEPITPVAVAPPPEPVPPVPPLPAVRLPEVPEVRHEPPAPVTSPARSGIQGQVSEVLQSILDDHPDERTRRATHQALPQEPAPRWHTTERGSEKPVQQPIERPIERPLERPVEREIERAIERPIERPMERPVPPPFDLPAERPAERHPVSVPGVARDIRQVVDLSRESHAYFYEIDQSYESRNNYLTRLWDDPDANVDAFTNQLLQIERAVPEDARTPFALGVLQLLAQRRVQGLTGLNRSLDLLTEQHDAEGITVVLSVLHTAFPDDVGISERLVEILERTGRKKEAAAVLFKLGEGVLARDNPRRALTYLERAGSQDPENRGVIMLQIRAYRSIGQEDRVLEAANRGQDEWPDDPVLLLHKAEALAKLGRQKAAEVCMDKAFREAGTNLSVLKIFKDELTTARDERNARRAADQIEALTDGPAEPRRVPDVPSFVAPPVEPVRPVEQVRRVDPKPASPPPVRPPPPVDIPPPRPAAPLAAQDADGDFFARLRKKLPKISQDVKNLQDLESSVRSRKERDSVDDQHLAELLRQFQVVGDKLKATAPDDASQVFHRGMSYLGWFRDLMFAVVWRDDFEKRIKACLNAKR